MLRPLVVTGPQSTPPSPYLLRYIISAAKLVPAAPVAGSVIYSDCEVYGLSSGHAGGNMSKSQDAKKSQKKEPTRTPKEKKELKRQKKEAAGR
jgi:hypothetical protein